MRYVYYNANPVGLRADDCTVRAISTVMDKDWDEVYLGLCFQGLRMHRMPSTNSVWGSYLEDHGFIRGAIPNTCPNCYTVRDFCREHQRGRYLLATGSHVIAVIDGDYFDTLDTGSEVPVYYWYEGEMKDAVV